MYYFFNIIYSQIFYCYLVIIKLLCIYYIFLKSYYNISSIFLAKRKKKSKKNNAKLNTGDNIQAETKDLHLVRRKEDVVNDKKCNTLLHIPTGIGLKNQRVPIEKNNVEIPDVNIALISKEDAPDYKNVQNSLEMESNAHTDYPIEEDMCKDAKNVASSMDDNSCQTKLSIELDDQMKCDSISKNIKKLIRLGIYAEKNIDDDSKTSEDNLTVADDYVECLGKSTLPEQTSSAATREADAKILRSENLVNPNNFKKSRCLLPRGKCSLLPLLFTFNLTCIPLI